jgi:type VI secretion system secreted protein VgrG
MRTLVAIMGVFIVITGLGAADSARPGAATTDQNVVVNGSQSVSVYANRSLNVGVDDFEVVGRNRAVNVGGDDQQAVGRNRTITVGSMESTSIGNGQTVRIGHDQQIAVGGTQAVSVGRDMNVTAGGNKTEQAVGSLMYRAGRTIVIDAHDEIVLRTGAASIQMKKDGTVVIRGKDITILGSGKINVREEGVVQKQTPGVQSK